MTRYYLIFNFTQKLDIINLNFYSIVYSPFRIIRHCVSGEPEQLYRLVTTSPRVNVSGVRCTPGHHWKNFLKPRRNLQMKTKNGLIKKKKFDTIFKIKLWACWKSVRFSIKKQTKTPLIFWQDTVQVFV